MNPTLILKLLLATALLLALATVVALNGDIRLLLQQAMDLLRASGPLVFFLAMALLPAIGAPLSFFCVTAGFAFAPQLGMGTVILLALAAIAANIALSYLLATRALRPLLQSILGRFGYQLPAVRPDNATDLIVLLRVTPGLPFPAQNYLLAMAGVPFIRYQFISCLIAFPLNTAIIVFGEALLQGRGRAALLGLMLILAVFAGTHLLRRHYRARTGH